MQVGQLNEERHSFFCNGCEKHRDGKPWRIFSLIRFCYYCCAAGKHERYMR